MFSQYTRYERPRVQTLHTSQILEMVGPVQGYVGGAPQPFFEFESQAAGSGTGTLNRR